MCGLAAMLVLGGGMADRAVIARMTNTLEHRGPDDSGSFFCGPVGFGFRRLAILDLSPSGHQPMSSEDGKITLVFNGEIYNYLELREQLQKLGYTFKSHSDTEVLLHAYTAWGAECLDKLNGMWAFLVYDQQRGVLFGSRDRFGMKPLYLHRGKRSILIASEIKAIRASGLYESDWNWAATSNFLVQSRLDDTRQSLYLEIEQLPPATAFELDLSGRYREWRYWGGMAITLMKSHSQTTPLLISSKTR